MCTFQILQWLENISLKKDLTPQISNLDLPHQFYAGDFSHWCLWMRSTLPLVSRLRSPSHPSSTKQPTPPGPGSPRSREDATSKTNLSSITFQLNSTGKLFENFNLKRRFLVCHVMLCFIKTVKGFAICLFSLIILRRDYLFLQTARCYPPQALSLKLVDVTLSNLSRELERLAALAKWVFSTDF